MYEYLQWIHFVVFLPLVVVKNYRGAALLLSMSAGIYLLMESQFDAWNQYKNIQGYLFRAALDGIVARMCWHWCGGFGKIQGAILAASSLCHVYAALELYTQWAFMYNHWVNATRALNILQLLVASEGVFRITRDISERVGRHSGGLVAGLPGYRFSLLRVGKEN